MDQMLSGTKGFQLPILARSLGQLATSFGGFVITCTVMYLSLAVSFWITLPISVLAAGFLVRIFIIQHDCGHGSFFRSRRANDLIGSLCGLMTLTPYAFWLASAARQAPRFLEQSRPARSKWVGYLLVVHDSHGIPGPRTLA
jgi:fatty acid desaturase